MVRPKLRLRPWKAGDETAFTPRQDFAQEQAMNAWDWAKGPPGPTWTIVAWDGSVTGIGGAVDCLDGAWSLWTQLSISPRGYWPHLLWLAARAIEEMKIKHRAQRFMAMARCGNHGAARCLARLGFEISGEELQVENVRYVLMRRAA